jgi:long-subunit fatty acid transport protein
MPLNSNQLDHPLSEYVLPAVLFIVLGGSWNLASAYDWSSDYGINTGVGVHDNYRLTDKDETDSTSFEVGGFVSIEGRTEISQVRLALRAKNRIFSDSSIDDETSYNLALNTSRTGERLSSYLSLAFDSASTTETELLDTGENKDGTRDTVTIAPGLSYQLDERNSLATDLSYRDVTYDTVSLTEYTNTSLALSWSYRFDETRSVTTRYVYSVYDPDDPKDPDDDGNTDTNSLSLGYGFSTSEATAYNITLGVTDVDGPQDSTTSGTGAFNVNHQTDERNNFSLSLSRNYEGSGRGDVRERDRINLQWNHGLSDRSQTTVSAEGVNADDRDYYTLAAGYNYNYTREVVLSASYRFRVRSEDEDSFDADSANSSTLLFKLSYSPL